MFVQRIITQGRFALSRSFTASRPTSSLLRTVSTTLPQRQPFSSNRSQQESIQTSTIESEPLPTATQNVSPEINARSIALQRLNKRTVTAEVEQFIREAGFNIKKMQQRIDRFTFFSDTCCFIEMGSVEEAQKAVEALNGQILLNTPILVRPLKSTFYWDQGFNKATRFFYHDKETPLQAIQPLLDGRRFMLETESPSWAVPEGSSKSINNTRREIIEKHLEPFGMEAYGAMSPSWRQSRRQRAFITQVDFATKEDAERAIEALNGTEVEGKKVWLVQSDVVPEIAKQIGKVHEGALAQLKEKGLVTAK